MAKQDEKLWEHRDKVALNPKKTETRTIQRKKKQRAKETKMVGTEEPQNSDETLNPM